MKNKLFISSALCAATFLSAQIDLSSTRFGITAGANYARVSNAHNPSGPRYTAQAGVLAMIPVDGNNQFFLQPEVEYYGAGETGRDKNAQGKPGYDAVYADDYISVPVYFKGYFSEAESEFFGLIGPRFNFLINQKVTNPSKPYYTVEGVGGVNGKASAFDFAASAGLGYSYKRKLEFAVKYDLGLTNKYKGLMNEPGSDPNIQKRKTQHVISAGISYIFD